MIAVELTFDPSKDARMELRPRHRELTKAAHEAGDVLMAGPYTDGTGALLLFNCSRERVDELLAADPYYSVDGVTVSSIREWDPVTGGPEPRA